MWRLALVLLFHVPLILLGGARAEAATDPPCSDPWDFCEGQERAIEAAVFGLEPLRSGHQPDVVQVFYVDDYSRPRAAVEMVRSQNGGARMTIIMPISPPEWPDNMGMSGFRRVVRTANVSPAQAELMFSRAENIFHAVEEVPETPNTVCIHPRAARLTVSLGGRTASRTRNTCYPDTLSELIYDIGDLAISLRPECAALDRETAGWTMYRLNACGRLSGDLRIAAEVTNIAKRWARPVKDEVSLHQMTERFDDAITLFWPEHGSRSGIEATAAFLAQQAAGKRLDVGIFSADAESSVRAVVRGGIDYRCTEGACSGRADFEQVWHRDGPGPWRIQTWTVEPFVIDTYE